MIVVIVVALLAAIAAPTVTYLLTRRERTQPGLFAVGGFAVHLGGVWASRAVLVNLVFPELKIGDYATLYRHGEISLDAYRQLEALQLRVTLATIACGLLAATLFGFAARLASRPAPPGELADGPGETQWVGRECAVCGSKIVRVDEGTACATCSTVLHLACAGRHGCNQARGEGYRAPAA